MHPRLLLAATFVLSLLPTATRADTLFTFRGPIFDPALSRGAENDRHSYISGSFVTTTKIFPGMIFGPLTVTTFTMTDGHLTFTPDNAEFTGYDFSISTDSKDRISSFIFTKQSTACSPNPYSTDPGNCYSLYQIFLAGTAETPGGPLVADDFSDTPFGDGENYRMPGDPADYATVTETDIKPTPEPSTLALLATGLVGVAGIVRRRCL